MTKITLDRETFKALASDTRLNILKALDGRRMSLTDIIQATNLNKATLHEHLTKLNEAGLVKRHEREGHKWVHYQLTWKGESLLHPENTRIVVLFTTTFIAFWVGILQLLWYVKGTVANIGYNIFTVGDTVVLTRSSEADFARYASLAGSENASALPPSLKMVLDFIHGNAFQTDSTSIPLNHDFSVITNAYTHGTSGSSLPFTEGSRLVVDESTGVLQAVSQDPLLLYLAVTCFLAFTVLLCVGIWRLWENKTQKL